MGNTNYLSQLGSKLKRKEDLSGIIDFRYVGSPILLRDIDVGLYIPSMADKERKTGIESFNLNTGDDISLIRGVYLASPNTVFKV